METSFRLINVIKSFSTTKKDTIKAINDISFSLPKNGIIFVVGKSGSGKSTLLNLLGGLDKPTSGSIVYEEQELNSFDVNRRNFYLKHELGFVFQEYYLLEDMNVFDNLSLVITDLIKDKIVINKRIENALFDVGLSGFEYRKISELSGGEKQRIGIARAIIKNAKVILCDEPTGNLDKENAKMIFEILKQLSLDKLVIVSSHEEGFAKEYADRIIRLEKGKIIEDTKSIEVPVETISSSSQNHSNFHLKTRFPSFNKIPIKLVMNNLKNNLLSLILTTIVLCFSLIALTTFIAISNYNSFDTFIDTLEYNQNYIVKVTSYVDHSVFIGDELYLYGISPTYERVNEEDNFLIEELTNNLLPAYNSFYFLKHFQDFLDYTFEADEYGSYPNDVYHKTYFTDMIIVDDFSQFNQPLRYGELPVDDNEVLIYDFMAMQLINTGSLTDVNSMEDMIGYVLTDKDTGLEMIISGILISQYEKFSYTAFGKPNQYPFEALYLSELQSIFALPDFKNLIMNEDEYISFNSLSIFNSTESEVSNDFYVRKLILTNDLSSFHFINTPESMADGGVLLSNVQLADMLNIDVIDITSQFLSDNYLEVRIKNPLMYQGAYQSWISARVLPVMGVYEADDMNHEYIYGYYPDGIQSSTIQNGTFRNVFLSLDKDWNINKEALISFEYPEIKEMSFYLNNPTYEEEGYMQYTPYTSLILEADHYMKAMKNTGITILIVLIWLCIFTVFNFTYRVIQKNIYKIGVLKSLGFNNTWISFIFGIEVFIIILFSCLLSILPSIYLTNIVNLDFVEIIGFNLVFFSFNFNNFVLSILSILLIGVVTLLLPLLIMIRNAPIRIIKTGKK